MAISQTALPSVAGIEISQAKRRLQEAGATVLITQCSSRKGVPDADSVRVLRERVKVDGQTGMIIVELLVAACKTRPSQQTPGGERH